MTEEKKHPNIRKIVYFDEGSAIDYLDITNGGLKNITEGANIKKSIFSRASAEGSVGTGIAFKALSPFLSIKAEGKAGADISRLGESILKTTISNTVLTDYLSVAPNDEKVKKLMGYNVCAFQGSISFIKMYSPYFSMINMDDQAINISKIDEVLEKGKGYYELIAKKENSNTDKEVVLRFNIKAFRNNYTLVDLTKMDLVFYGIEVGKMDINDLDAEKEFSSLNFKKNTNVNEIIGTFEVSAEISGSDCKNYSQVYDIILAGISSDG